MESEKFIFLLRNEGIALFQDLRKKTQTQDKKYDLEYKHIATYFLQELKKTLTNFLSYDHDNPQVVIHDLSMLEQRKQEIIQSKNAITMDSYSTLPNAFPLGVSRIFNHLGEEMLTLDARPGYQMIQSQIASFKSKLINQECYLVDDDSYTGETMRYIVSLLHKDGIKKLKSLVGICVNNSGSFENETESIYYYKRSEVIDMSDPRDFFIGSYEGGLVIQESNNSLVRVPYILPFCNPHSRVGIENSFSKAFSLAILDLNVECYEEIESLIQKPLYIGDLWIYFSNLLHTKGIGNNVKVLDYINQTKLILETKENLIPVTMHVENAL